MLRSVVYLKKDFLLALIANASLRWPAVRIQFAAWLASSIRTDLPCKAVAAGEAHFQTDALITPLAFGAIVVFRARSRTLSLSASLPGRAIGSHIAGCRDPDAALFRHWIANETVRTGADSSVVFDPANCIGPASFLGTWVWKRRTDT